MWGYRTNSESVYRIDGINKPCRIMNYGKIILYGNASETGSLSMPLRTTNISISEYRYSFGINGVMMTLSKIILKRDLKKRNDELGLNLLENVNSFGGNSFINFINEYNSKSE